jgi:DNA-directed RNA polymerase alpha subunit
MKKSKIRFGCFGILIILLISLSACGGNKVVTSEEVDWQTAVEVLNSGQVTEIMQTHDLQVTLTLDDGSQIVTVEPSIDDIFREVELCGNTCSKIVLITE